MPWNLTVFGARKVSLTKAVRIRDKRPNRLDFGELDKLEEPGHFMKGMIVILVHLDPCNIRIPCCYQETMLRLLHASGRYQGTFIDVPLQGAK